MTGAASRRAKLRRLVDGDGVEFVSPPILMTADVFFDLLGEELGRRLILTMASDSTEYCLRPEFTLPIALAYLGERTSEPRAYGYLGPVFRQRDDAPAEFDQAGLELIAERDPQEALGRVLQFARSALALYGVGRPAVRVGSVALFEAVLGAADIPPVWRPRLRHRFGNPEAMLHLLDRLADPHDHAGRELALSREELVARIAAQMVETGLSLASSRTPDEIADRYLEQQALAAARVPASTLDLLRDYLGIAGDARNALARVDTLAREHALDIGQPLAAMEQYLALIERDGPMSALVFDANFSPRLDYYTGIVFMMTGRGGQILASGGQYDRLLQRLGSAAEIPAAGCAVWIERLEGEVRP
jgi:ATP phosphoribosyltransferase regulatory subunit